MGNCQPSGLPEEDPNEFFAGIAPYGTSTCGSLPSRPGKGGGPGDHDRAKQDAKEQLKEWQDRMGACTEAENMMPLGQTMEDPLLKMLAGSTLDNRPRGATRRAEEGGGRMGDCSSAVAEAPQPFTFGVERASPAGEEATARDAESEVDEADDLRRQHESDLLRKHQHEAEMSREREVEVREDSRDFGRDLEKLPEAAPESNLLAQDSRDLGHDLEKLPEAVPESNQLAQEHEEPRELRDTYSYAGAGVGRQEQASSRHVPTSAPSNQAVAVARRQAPAVQRPVDESLLPAAPPLRRWADPVDEQSTMTPAVGSTMPASQPGADGPVPFANMMEAKLKAKEWQFQLKMEMKMIEREIKKVQKDEGKLQKQIAEKAARGHTMEVEQLARSIVASRKTASRLELAKASMHNVDLQLSQAIVAASMKHSLHVSADIMREMNAIARVQDVGSVVEGMRQEMAQCTEAGSVMEDALHVDEDEEDVRLEVERVMEEVDLERIRLLGGTGARAASAAGASDPAQPGRAQPAAPRAGARSRAS